MKLNQSFAPQRDVHSEGGSKIPPTINIHMLARCNMACGFCFAGFKASERQQMERKTLLEIIRQTASFPRQMRNGHLRPRKVTFVGGEPFLHPDLPEVLKLAHLLGLKTAVITNGWFLDAKRISELAPYLDMVGISIDSADAGTNARIGRKCGRAVLSREDYLSRVRLLRTHGVAVKINTVVNSQNKNEDFTPFMREALPFRWKIFQCARIEGENDGRFDHWAISAGDFENFVQQHVTLEDCGIKVVPETQTQMRASYAIIAPNGSFVDNSTGAYRYSSPICDVGIENAFEEVHFSLDDFHARSGEYDLLTGMN